MQTMKMFLIASVFSVLTAQLFAAEIKVCDMFARPGTQETLHIAVFDVLDMAGGDVEINFDSGLLSAKSVSKGALLASSPLEFFIASNLDPCPPGEDCPPPLPGVAKLSFASAQGVNSPAGEFGEVANVVYEALSGAPEGQNTSVTFSALSLYDSVPEPFAAAARPGKVYFTSGMAVGVSTDKIIYLGGEVIRISAFAFNPFKSPRDVEFYFALLFPDRTLRFLPSFSTDHQDGRIAFTMPSATSYPETPLFQPIAGQVLPPGSYILYGAMFEPGTLDPPIAPLFWAEFVVQG